MGVPLLRAGEWTYSPEGEIEARLMEVQRDVNALAVLARAAEMTVVSLKGKAPHPIDPAFRTALEKYRLRGFAIDSVANAS